MILVCSDKKTGKSGQIEIDQQKASVLINAKMSDVIDGDIFGLPGYKLKITGGSDKSGFPMAKEMHGTAKKKTMKKISKTGAMKGQYRRALLRGNTISQEIQQVNAVVIEQGSIPFEEIFKGKEKEAVAPPKAK